MINSVKDDVTIDGNNNMEFKLDVKPEFAMITCTEFKEFMCDSSVEMLIIDCRPHLDFEASKLLYKGCFNVPGEKITNRYGVLCFVRCLFAI